ncbi:MAG TPA: ADP-ribosylglycohydrolase family protein, partial [Pelovirga sp.]|nr:ADP-ribosylglycohydrolase family protein [Pelovirga sp.]
MGEITIKDRAQGAMLGALIGDALALGPHWYYDLKEMQRDYGEWISYYTEPKPDRYHAGLKAGELSQSGYLLTMMLQSLAECSGYDESDFCRRLETELFPQLDGTPMSGPGGYTSQSIREAWRRRVQQKLPWSQTGGHADTTEAIERNLAIAVRYALQPKQLAAAVTSNTLLTQTDDTLVSMTVAYGAVLSLLVQGHKLDSGISNKLMKLVKTGQLPFHAVTSDNLQPPQPGDSDPPRVGRFASPDALLSPSYMAAAAIDPNIRIEPA